MTIGSKINKNLHKVFFSIKLTFFMKIIGTATDTFLASKGFQYLNFLETILTKINYYLHFMKNSTDFSLKNAFSLVFSTTLFMGYKVCYALKHC